MTTLPKMVDSKGRVSLGKGFANSLVLIQELADGLIRVVRARAVPELESWLYNNPEALQMVMEGIEQAKNGQLIDGPNLEEMEKLADDMVA